MYHAKVLESVPTQPGCWAHLRVGVFQGEAQVGEYKRNYSAMYDTFFPFKQGDEWFALYSSDYTATRVMRLPSCEDVAGEDPHGHGFCPVDFYVPQVDEDGDADADELGDLAGTFGFVAGCVWGDDSSWKIQYLDLSRISEGILGRDDRFGYIEMPRHAKSLKDCISFRYFSEDEPQIHISQDVPFYLNGKNAEGQAVLKQEASDAFWAQRKLERDKLEALTGHKVTGWTMVDGAIPIIKKSDGIEYIVRWDGVGEPAYQPREEWIASLRK
jgi:hypothetical protein